MSSFSFIHTADLHLDSPFKSMSYTESIREWLKNASLETFVSLVDLAIERSVDCIIFAGDLYDGEEVGLRAQFKFMEELKRASDAGIFSYILLGNHDPENIFSAISEWPDRVCFFSKDHLTEYTLARNGNVLAKIRGKSFSEGMSGKDIIAEFRRCDPYSGFTIGIYHGDVSDSSISDSEYASCTVNDLLSVSDMDYWALGHLHQFRIIRDQNPAIVYSGTLQGRSLKPSECGKKGVSYGRVVDGRLSETSFIPLSKVEFHEIDCSPGDHDSLVSLVHAVCGDIKDKLQVRDSTLMCLRIILTLEGRSVTLFSRSGKREECQIMIREILLHDKVYVSECKVKLLKSSDSVLTDEILSSCRSLLDQSEESKQEYLAKLFSEERKLLSPKDAYDIRRLEEEALTLISLNLSSCMEEE